MPLHMCVDVESLATDIAAVLHVAGVFPLVLLQVVPLLVLLATAFK